MLSAGDVGGPIYLCDFRVSVDGDWLCLKKLEEMEAASALAASNSNTECSSSSLASDTGIYF